MADTTQRIALLADVHGNQTALEAVLADADAQGVTATWFLGDLFLPGPSAAGLVALLEARHPGVWLNGNWEGAMLEIADGTQPLTGPTVVYLAMLTQYAQRQLSAAQWQQVAARPFVTTRRVNGLTIVAAHNSRLAPDGRSLYPSQPQPAFDALAGDADLAVYGHTHQQLMRPSSQGQLIVNPGAVGQPYSPWPQFFKDQRAHYAILTIDPAGRLDVAFRKVPYDISREIARAEAANLPYADLYRHLRETGETITHDQALLGRINRERGYDRAAQAAFGDRS
ncbi:metallophosphoesterase family protein [Lacticaseibacillus parakribbianus]|uniref:metallophosphoesterase family protein n=1 Tax=Lacticaseibacillus parakribbianus TaxID=2970927 RepID=UPI0021CB2B63|nr:metallophosphoesterase family protein [Lacticaseibacillus parakribbianus]